MIVLPIMSPMRKSYTRSPTALHASLNWVILLGEVVKAFVSLWLVVLSPFSHLLIPLYLCLQGLFSPVQGGKSDNISRKNALLVTLFATGASQIFLFFSMLFPYGSICSTSLLIIGLCVQGRWANIPAVSRAALSDIEDHSHLNFTIPLSFAILFFPWVFMLKTFPESMGNFSNFFASYPVQGACVRIAPLVILLCSGLLYYDAKQRFCDKEDRALKLGNRKTEPKITQLITSSGLRRIWLHVKYEPFFMRFELARTKALLSKHALLWIGCFCYEYGFHSTFYYLDESGLFVTEGFLTHSSFFAYFTAGVLFKPVFISSNRLGILLGVLISICSVFVRDTGLNPAIWQGAMGFGSGMFLSCFYLHCMTHQKTHVRGKIVGAADSMQTLGELAGTLTYFCVSTGFIIFLPNSTSVLPLYFSPVLFGASLVCFVLSFQRPNDF